MPDIVIGPLNLGSAATGLTLTAKVNSGDDLIASVPMDVELPSGSGRYSGTFDSPVSAADYDGDIEDSGGINYGTFRFSTDSSGNEITSVELPNPAPAGYGGDAPTVEEIDTQLSGTHGSGDWGATGTPAPTVEEIDAQLSAVHGSGTWSPLSGTGANAVTVLVDDGSNPIQGASIRWTRNGIPVTMATDSEGNAEFSLDDGDYTVSITSPGFTYTPTVQTVDAGHVDFTLSMTQTAIIPAPPSGIQSMGWIYCYDGQGAVVSGAILSFAETATGSTSSDSTAEFTGTSDEEGLLSVAFRIGASYEGWRGDGRRVTFGVPNNESFQLPQILGKP